MAYCNVRNYYKERSYRLLNEWKLFQKLNADQELIQLEHPHADLQEFYHGLRNRLTEEEKKQALQSEFDKIKQAQLAKNLEKKEPFEYYRFIYESEVVISRLPAPGIRMLPYKYHTGRITTSDSKVPETGYPLHPRIKSILVQKYPQYLNIPNEYCRPLGTTDATFNDFNKPQKQSDPIPEYRRDRILKHVTRLLGATPYLPLHYVDTQYTGLPLNTGTGYHNRHSFKINAHAKFSAPEEYRHMPTSKGYYINAFLEHARTLIHYIKYTGLPYPPPEIQDDSEQSMNLIDDMLETFFNQYPTQLYTRSHISKREGPLKARPVYAVDELFLTIESMLTFPLHVQARKMNSSIMYSLETIRGGNVFLDQLAQKYTSFFTIDWSSFDQTVPRVITDIFFTHFLPSLLITSHGYHPTYEYPTHESLTKEKFPEMMANLISFLHLWFNYMTFITSDGYAYRRTLAGLPSDAMIEFGLSDEEIQQVKIFVMGDDNSAFTRWPLTKAEAFINFISDYASNRWNMSLSKTKCKVTDQRNKIETLSYQCNFGKPKRDLDKLVAQLCYPERGVKEKYMSARAIGIAYAACGQDITFHEFCHDIFREFRDEAAELNDEMRQKFAKYLPGQFNVLDDPTFFLKTFNFPSIASHAAGGRKVSLLASIILGQLKIRTTDS